MSYAGLEDLKTRLEGRRTRADEELLEALESGDEAKAAELVGRKGRANPNAKSDAGESALHLAARGRMRTAIRALLEAGADVSARNASGKTPMEAERGSLERTKGMATASHALEWMRERAGFEGWAGGHVSRLQAAAGRGDARSVERLLGGGAEPDWRPGGDDTMTAFQMAAAKGHWGIAKRLMQAGADVSATWEEALFMGGRARRTALTMAARRGDSAGAVRLLEWGAKAGEAEEVERFWSGKRTVRSAAELAKGATRWFLILSEAERAEGKESEPRALEAEKEKELVAFEKMTAEQIGMLREKEEARRDMERAQSRLREIEEAERAMGQGEPERRAGPRAPRG